MECFPLFEIVEFLDIISAYPLYAGLLLGWFLVHLSYSDNKQKFSKDHSLFSNRVRLRSETLQIKLEIRINPVITWLFKAIKKYERDGDDDSTISSFNFI